MAAATASNIASERFGARSASGVARSVMTVALEIFTASRRGEFAAVDPTLGQLLGRTPATFRDVLAATLPA